MANEEKPEFSFAGLSLLPLEEDTPAPVAPAAKPLLDTRHTADRRSLPDRRSSVRFQESRRSGKPRRPGDNPWAPGSGV
ncbi:hypothetical protein [Pseudomonas sp. N040]|uniref:hypothetical protein n=1 Tax=Pseudomonas sp. N040 TaxID=2785325 RepID=UPI0018A2BF98|nr:hypothetical protein [Pseudomonas sp. N040]MBF7728848.1 hypothetical protein [Pseudomonas sp. N040]MBW7012488.1 hypothetical protein [Pseudomonas sp. N040]